jgi:hypothetical protein
MSGSLQNVAIDGQDAREKQSSALGAEEDKRQVWRG